MRAKINKAAEKVVEEKDGPHELTNITVKEVSVVDRAANKRTFLVTKSKKNAAGAPVTTDEDDTDLAALGPVGKSKDDLAAKLDAEDAAAVGKTDAQKVLDAKDAADKAEIERLKAVGTSGAPAAPIVAPIVAPIDALKALDQLVAEVAPVVAAAVPTKKDGVPAEVVVVSAPVPLSATAESVKAAILAGIDQIMSKATEWRAAVAASTSENTDNVSGRPYAVWDYSYYIYRMIDSISNIGGPDWEMLNATIGKELAAKDVDVTKANKAITAARVGMLKGVHDGLQHCAGAMGKVMKELTEEAPDEVVAPDAGASFAKAAPAAAPVVAPVVAPPVLVTDPALLAKVEELISKQAKSDEVVASLRGVVQAQAAELAQSRGEVSSNVISSDATQIAKKTSDRDNLEWSDELDLAPKRVHSRVIRF
jgi:hypothetical protein